MINGNLFEVLFLGGGLLIVFVIAEIYARRKTVMVFRGKAIS